MSLFLLPYPLLDPVILQIGPITIRWYAFAYIGGLLLGCLYIRWFLHRPALWGPTPPKDLELDSLMTYMAFGVILGGRLGYVLFYNPHFYLMHPKDIFAIWEGGMSFHGGLIGATLALFLLCWRRSWPVFPLLDLCSAAAPIGLFLGRLANFINGELWGRPAPNLSFAVIFPEADFWPRHPSQLYEAATEGVLLFIILAFVIARYGFRRPGLITGLFALLYGIARIGCELFREPDPQLGFIGENLTMGMILSLPMIIIGISLVVYASWPYGKNGMLAVERSQR